MFIFLVLSFTATKRKRISKWSNGSVSCYAMLNVNDKKKSKLNTTEFFTFGIKQFCIGLICI